MDSDRRAELVGFLEMLNLRYLWNMPGELLSKQLNLMICDLGRSSDLE